MTLLERKLDDSFPLERWLAWEASTNYRLHNVREWQKVFQVLEDVRLGMETRSMTAETHSHLDNFPYRVVLADRDRCNSFSASCTIEATGLGERDLPQGWCCSSDRQNVYRPSLTTVEQEGRCEAASRFWERAAWVIAGMPGSIFSRKLICIAVLMPSKVSASHGSRPYHHDIASNTLLVRRQRISLRMWSKERPA